MNDDTILSDRINYGIHAKLKQQCCVVIEKLPETKHLRFRSKVKSNTNVRQHSVSSKCRNQHLKQLKKLKKIDKTSSTNGHIQPLQTVDVILEPEPASTDSENISLQMELSDDDIVKIIDEVSCFIDDGVWGSICDILDETIQPTASIVNVNPEPLPQLGVISTREGNIMSTPTDSVNQQIQSTQLHDDRATVSTQTSTSNSIYTNLHQIVEPSQGVAEEPMQNYGLTSSLYFPHIPNSLIGLKPIKSSTDSSPLPANNSEMGVSNQLTWQSNFDFMKMTVLNMLQTPCNEYIRFGHCGVQHCRYNHFLPPASVVGRTIQDWSNETIHFLYVTFIQQYKRCHLMYFDVICTVYVKRQQPENLLAAVNDCERLGTEDNLAVIFDGLIKCGFTQDDALFRICSHALLLTNTIQSILTILVSMKVSSFKRTISFLLTQIEFYDFHPMLGDEILKQVGELETLDETVLEFCCCIVKKLNKTLNQDYLKKLLLKC